MAIDFSQLIWSSLGNTTYTVTNRKDFFSVQTTGTSKRLFRVDWKHDFYNDHCQFVGDLHGTVDLINGEATVIRQKMYLGMNIVIIPPEIETISSFYLNHYASYKGTFSLEYFEPTTQVVINPFTNQPVILGQEALNSIENINELYSQQIIDNLTTQITNNIANELQEIETQIQNIKNLLKNIS